MDEGKQVSGGDLLKALVKVDGNPCVKRCKFREVQKSFLDDVFERRSGPTGAGIDPTRDDLSMYQLNIPVAQENVLWGLRRKGIVFTLVQEVDCEGLNTVRTTIVVFICKPGDIKNAELLVACNFLPVVYPRQYDLSERLSQFRSVVI